MNDHWTRFHRHEPRWLYCPSNGDIDWLLERDQAVEDHGYNAFIRDIDVIVMGRGTYEAVRSMGEADVRGRSTRLCGWRARHSIFPRTLHDQ